MDETELLIKDLCARVPYNTIVSVADFTDGKVTWNKEKLTLSLLHRIEEEEGAWGFIKPYLRSMDDMTEEEKKELEQENIRIYVLDNNSFNACKYFHNVWEEPPLESDDWLTLIDWFNKHHFDYHNLIEKGLAIKASKGMYQIRTTKD